MSLEKKIEAEFKVAMKARDAVKVSTIRMLKAEINNFKLEQNKSSLTDEQLIKIVRRQVKQHALSMLRRGEVAVHSKKFWWFLQGLWNYWFSQEEDTMAENVLTPEKVMEMGMVWSKQVLALLPPEERLAGLTLEERLAGLTLKEIKEIERYLHAIKEQAASTPSETPG